MTISKLALLATIMFGTLVLSGCAHQREMYKLPSDVDALRQMTELAGRNADQALQETESLRGELAAVRKASESASTDAAATRQMLEQLNARLNSGASSSTLK